MEDKRLDFDAPLLSVRRFSAPGPASFAASASNAWESNRATGKPPPPPRRSSLPFYKSELKSGPVRNPGVVPFVWEHTPGQPKDRPRPLGRLPVAPKLPPSRASNDKEPEKPITSARTHGPIPASSQSPEVKEEKQQQPIPADCREEEEDDDGDDAFLDAVDTLSLTESFFMNCSVSGLSGIPDAMEPSSGNFATDPQVRDFMMGRFLPAAQAAAVSSPQCAPRKPREPMRSVEREERRDYRRQAPLSYRYGPSSVPQYARTQEEHKGGSYHDEDDEEYDDTGHLSSKACGLLPRFCLKSSFCLLNPVPGMKVRSRLPPPPGRRISSSQIRTSHRGSLAQVEDENPWEAVYKNKSGHGDQHQGDDGSRLTNESNHLTYTYSSDSQTADGSSPYRHSNGGAISPYRNEASRSPFHEGKGFLGVPLSERKISGADGSGSYEKDGENYSEVTRRDDSEQGSGLMSPAIERTLYVDTAHMLETPHSKSSSVASNVEVKGMLKPTNKDCEVGVVESCDWDASQPNVSELVGYKDDDNDFKHNDSNDGPLPLKTDDQVKKGASFLPPSLLPPPLPKSPSESWLCHTFPSVSSKNPPQQSFLGIQFQPRKQALRAASADPKQESNGKTVEVHRQIRFADMLTKPLSPESEI